MDLGDLWFGPVHGMRAVRCGPAGGADKGNGLVNGHVGGVVVNGALARVAVHCEGDHRSECRWSVVFQTLEKAVRSHSAHKSAVDARFAEDFLYVLR